MSAFEKLKELLKSQGKLSTDDVEKLVKEHGEMSNDEKMWLESEKLEIEKKAKQTETITMDQYLAALKVLDSAAEDSDEYKTAEALVDKYESGG